MLNQIQYRRLKTGGSTVTDVTWKVTSSAEKNIESLYILVWCKLFMFNIWEKTSKNFSPSPDSAVLKVWGRNLTKTCSKLRTHFKSIVLEICSNDFFQHPIQSISTCYFCHVSLNYQGPYFDEINNTLKTGICLILFIVFDNEFEISLIILISKKS